MSLSTFPTYGCYSGFQGALEFHPSLSLGAAGLCAGPMCFWEVKPRISTLMDDPVFPTFTSAVLMMEQNLLYPSGPHTASGKSIYRDPVAPAWSGTGQVFMEKGWKVGRTVT